MKPSGLDEARRWLAEADEDLRVCQTLRAAGHFSRACFHGQQAAEQAVKAFLHARGADDPWGHSVRRLIEEAETFEKSWESFQTLASRLDRYYIPTRYPNGLPAGLPSEAFFESDAQEAADMASQVLERARQSICP